MPSSRLSNTSWGGCALWSVAFLVVVIGGCVIGLALRPDPNAPAQVAEGQGWKVEVRKDDLDDPCTELIIGNRVRAGQCGYAVGAGTSEPRNEDEPPEYRATSAEVGGGTIVIFGPVPDDAAQVRLRLADGSRPVVPVEEKKGVRYFVRVGEVADRGPTMLLDASGGVVEPPS